MAINLENELERARMFLATAVKPLLPDIPLKTRLSLAQTLGSDENIDRLVAVIKLHRPIADETPPWEDDECLNEALNAMEQDCRKEIAQRKKLKEEAANRLAEAQKEYDDFISIPKEKRLIMNETAVIPCRKIQSKDDTLLVKERAAPFLYRRPSFMAETTQSHIDVDRTSCDYHVRRNETDAEKLGILVQSSTDCKLPVTSTPHVASRLARTMSVEEGRALFGSEEEITETRMIRRSSSVHFQEPLLRQGTFEIDQQNENKNPNRDRTFDTGLKSILKQDHTMIVKSDLASTLATIKPSSETKMLPKIAPRIKTETTKRPNVANKIASKTVIPTKSLPIPSRTLLPSKVNPAPASKSSRAPSGIVRPSKVATRLPARK